MITNLLNFEGDLEPTKQKALNSNSTIAVLYWVVPADSSSSKPISTGIKYHRSVLFIVHQISRAVM